MLGALVLFAGLADASDSSSGSSSLLQEHDCVAFAQGIQACITTFARIANDHASLESQAVTLFGYLGIDQWRLFLYPSKEAYDYADNASLIQIDAPYDAAVRLAQSHGVNTWKS